MPEAVRKTKYQPRTQAIGKPTYRLSDIATMPRSPIKTTIDIDTEAAGKNCGNSKIENNAPVIEMSPNSQTKAFASGQQGTPTANPMACLLVKCITFPGTCLANCLKP
jgi:hypothetical protein